MINHLHDLKGDTILTAVVNDVDMCIGVCDC